MNFLDRLATIVIENNSTTEILHDQSSLVSWNEAVESFLASPPDGSASNGEDNKEEAQKSSVADVAVALERGIMIAVLREGFTKDERDFDLQRHRDLALIKCEQPLDEIDIQQLFEFVRACKNLLRWFIQIHLAKTGAILPSPIRNLQSTSLLSLLVKIMEHQVGLATSYSQEFARNISLYLFYATYTAIPGDDTPRTALQHLIEELSYQRLALRMLTRKCTAALALAVVRNLHNAAVTLPGAAANILETSTKWDAGTPEAAPWTPAESTELSFQSICSSIMSWALSSPPNFPGGVDDKRSELVAEILGAFYAFRFGQQLLPVNGNPDLAKLVVQLLKLPQDEDSRIDQCRLSTVSLLMDSDRSFGEVLVKEGGIVPLLGILESQVTDVLSQTRVDNSATAALVPSLVALNKYASANTEVRQKVKLFVFPASAEGQFQVKVEEHRQTNGSKNMGPLDAPEGTLRRKLTTLMTWPEGHIKRCTGELLWTLCSSDAGEFVHRVGFGNALPILSVKGYATMPVQP